MTDYKNILIIKPSALGDIVHTLPVLDIIRQTWKDAKISWFVRAEFADLLRDNPAIDELIIFKRKQLGRFWYKKDAFKEFVSLIKTLREGKFDIVFDFQGLFRTALFAFLTKAKRRIGMIDAREGAGFFYTDKVKINTSINVSDYYIQMLKYAGATAGDIKFNIPINLNAKDSVCGMLSEQRLAGDDYILFIPGAAHNYKCWKSENFAKLADILNSTTGLKIAATGTKQEKDIIQDIQRHSKTDIIDFSGRTDISQLTALIDNAKLIVSNDTGPGHIAAALGKKLVMVFGRTNPRRVGPYGRAECVAAVDAFSRDERIESRNPEHSIENVTVQMVLDKINQQLSNA